MEKTYKILESNVYNKELHRICKYISYTLDSKISAKDLLIRIRLKLEIVQDFPRAFQIMVKNKHYEFRRIVIKNFIIIYKIDIQKRIIYILHIFYNKTNYFKKIK